MLLNRHGNLLNFYKLTLEPDITHPSILLFDYLCASFTTKYAFLPVRILTEVWSQFFTDCKTLQ
jgi:hypothetical protein